MQTYRSLPKLMFPGLLGLVMLLPARPAAAQPGDAWIELIRGRSVRYRAKGGSGWRALPADTYVHAGDKIRVPSGNTIRIKYRKGKSRIVRGLKIVTIRRVRGRKPKPGNMGLGEFLKLLLSRQKSYHRVGSGTLSGGSGSPGYINLIGPRYSIVSPQTRVTLTWARKGKAKSYQITLWRFLKNGGEKKITSKVPCTTSRCQWKVVPKYKLSAGVRYYWQVKVAGSSHDAYPSTGVWFQVASTKRLASLKKQLVIAQKAPVKKRSLKQIIAYALYGFHHQALDRLAKPGVSPSGPPKQLRAKLLCLICRTAQANRVAGKKICKCKEE